MTDSEKLNNACLRLRHALKNPYAITRKEQGKKNVENAWRRLSTLSTQKKLATSKSRFFYS